MSRSREDYIRYSLYLNRLLPQKSVFLLLSSGGTCLFCEGIRRVLWTDYFLQKYLLLPSRGSVSVCTVKEYVLYSQSFNRALPSSRLVTAGVSLYWDEQHHIFMASEQSASLLLSIGKVLQTPSGTSPCGTRSKWQHYHAWRGHLHRWPSRHCRTQQAL